MVFRQVVLLAEGLKEGPFPRSFSDMEKELLVKPVEKNELNISNIVELSMVYTISNSL